MERGKVPDIAARSAAGRLFSYTPTCLVDILYPIQMPNDTSTILLVLSSNQFKMYQIHDFSIYEFSFIGIFSFNFSNSIIFILKFLSDLHKTRSIATASQKSTQTKMLDVFNNKVQQGYKPFPNT